MNRLSMGPEEIRLLASSLKKVSFFSNMSIGDMEKFINVTNLYEFKPGHSLFKKGDVGDALYVVYSGLVRVFDRPFFLWPTKTIATLQAGDIFGEMALMDQPYRTASAVTVGPTKLFVLLNTNFNDILNANPAFAKELRGMAKSRTFENKHN